MQPPVCTPTDPALFFSRNDPNDQRLGDVVLREPVAYASADIVLLGVPQDQGVRRNGGRPGAALAPTEIRRWLYRLTTNGMDKLRLYDAGDVPLGDTLEATHDTQRSLVAEIIKSGKRLVVLGGGNDISYPDCAGLHDAVGTVWGCNIDAHFDVRADTPRNSGTPYRQLLKEGKLVGSRFWEIGGQPWVNSAVYTRYLHEQGATMALLPEVLERGIEAILADMCALAGSYVALFWGLDMDVVRAADAPGVSAPNPTGLPGEALCRVACIAGGDRRSRLFEISEVNPLHDIDGRTARLAAIVVWHFLQHATATHQSFENKNN